MLGLFRNSKQVRVTMVAVDVSQRSKKGSAHLTLTNQDKKVGFRSCGYLYIN